MNELTKNASGVAWIPSIGVLITSLLMIHPAHGQVPAPFVGTWKAAWQTEKKAYEAVMTVTDTGGTWQTATLDKNNPCAGREVPMKVESSSATAIRLQLRFSEIMTGCQNVNVELKLGPDGSVTGTRSKYELSLTKKQP